MFQCNAMSHNIKKKEKIPTRGIGSCTGSQRHCRHESHFLKSSMTKLQLLDPFNSWLTGLHQNKNVLYLNLLKVLLIDHLLMQNALCFTPTDHQQIIKEIQTTMQECEGWVVLKIKSAFWNMVNGQSIAAWMDALARMNSDYMRWCCFHNTGMSF